MSQFLQDINAFRMNLYAVNFDQTKNLLLLFRSLEHDLRKRIINLLGENKMTVTELFLKLKIEQSVASQHLSILKEVGIVRAERVGKNIFYSLIEGRLREINDLSMIINDGLAPKNLVKHKTELVNNLFASLVHESKLDLSTQILRAFSHDFRLKLIEFILSQPNSSVYSIYSSLGLEQSITSQQLKILREAQLVYTRREGKNIFYSVNNLLVQNIEKALATLA